jgi:hypothetical protein
MSIAVVISLTLAGLVIGAALAWLATRSASTAVAKRKAELERELMSIKTLVTQKQAEILLFFPPRPLPKLR